MNTSLSQIGGLLVIVTAGTAISAHAGMTDFSDSPVGFQGTSFESGGITFSDALWFPGGISLQFSVSNATGNFAFQPGQPLAEYFSPPNVMRIGATSDGTDAPLTRMHSFTMTTGEIATLGRLDLFYTDGSLWAGTNIALEAWLDGELVATDSFTLTGIASDPTLHREMLIDGVEFDTLRLIATGGTMPGEMDGFLGLVDNVAMVLPAPHSIGALGALFILPGRRRRAS